MYTTKHLYFKDVALYQDVIRWCKKLNLNFSQLVIEALRDKIRQLQQSEGETNDPTEIVRMPLSERRKLLAKQAGQMADYYSRQEDWETGEFTGYE